MRLLLIWFSTFFLLFYVYFFSGLQITIDGIGDKTQPQRFDWLDGVCFYFTFSVFGRKKSSQIVLIYEIKQTNFRHEFVA